MAKLLGEDAHKAARNQTIKKLRPMKKAFFSVAKETSQPKQNPKNLVSCTAIPAHPITESIF